MMSAAAAVYFVALTMRGQAPGGNNVVAALRHGKPVYYEVADPLLYRALLSLNRPMRNWFVCLLSVPKRVGQASIPLTADFVMANFARDTLMGGIMSRHGFKPILDSARGLKSRIATDQNYRDFIANGGGFSSYLVDEDAFKHHLDRFYASKGIDPATAMNSPRKLLLGIERIADAFEMSTRLGEFAKARKKGAHPRHAAYLAREVSTDFAMCGDNAALGFFYDTVMFLKAGVNGLDRLYRGLAQDPNKARIAGWSAFLAMTSMAIYAMNRGNPLYDDLEDWDRDTLWHLFPPTSATIQAWSNGEELPPLEERYFHLRYPKIWEIGAIASVAERALEGFLDGEPLKAAGHMVKIFRDLFRMDPIPQALAPLVEQYANRRRFFDTPIETQATQGLPRWMRAERHTSQTLRAAGEATRNLPRALQAPPARLEALLRGYLNTWAMYGLSLSDAVLFDDMPDMRVDQYPVLRRFYRQTPARNTRFRTKFYDVLREATETRRGMRQLDRALRPDLAGELENKPANAHHDQLVRANKSMQAMRREMDLVRRTDSLDELKQYALALKGDPSLKKRIGKI